MFDLGKDEFSGLAGGARAGVTGESFFLVAPDAGVVLEEVANGFPDCLCRSGERAGLKPFQQFNVSFFLSRDDVVNEHGALGGDRFVNRGASRLANDQVMGGEKFGDFPGPPLDVNPAGKFFFERLNLTIQPTDISAQNDGDLGIVTENGPDDVVDMRGFCGGEKEDPERADGVVCSDFWKVLEPRAYREADDVDFFGGQILSDEAFAGVIIGDEKVITGRAGPGGVDFDGIGNDRDDGNAGTGLELAFHHVGIQRVGIDHDVRPEVIEKPGDGILGFCDERERFRKVLTVGGAIHPGPDSRSVGGDFTIGPAKKTVDAGIPQITGVGNENPGLLLQGFGQVTGGAIVAVTEAGGENQDLGLHTFEVWNKI